MKPANLLTLFRRIVNWQAFGLAGLAVSGIAAVPSPVPAYPVPVCKEGQGSFETIYAEAATKSMFADIGVAIQWKNVKECPAGAIRIRILDSAPSSEKQGVLAYALPDEGRIVIYLDRVRATVPATTAPKLMAHVIVHEITHVLEGSPRHSAVGLMVPMWTANDYARMARRPLPFDPVDIQLIHEGLRLRQEAMLGEGERARIVPNWQ